MRIYPYLLSLIALFCCCPALDAQTSLPSLKNFPRPNPEPAPPGDRFDPPVSGTVSAQAPACAEWTRSAGPDESLVMTGINFSLYGGEEEGKDAKFLVYGNSGLSNQVKLQRIYADKTMLTLGKELPAWSMYLLWPGNEKGWGNPVAINQTDAWWVGPNQAPAGASVSVYGRNLAHGNGTSSSNVWIRSANGAGRWANVTDVNPYKVDFTVPADMPEGDYEIWTHNGHGGSYGWSGPLQLRLTGGNRFTQAQVNVKNYGARGDGSADDLEPIKQALAAAARLGHATVYFPAGVYMVSGTLEMAGSTRWLGDGPANTVIKCAPNFSATALGLLFANIKGAEITGLTFDGNGNFRGKLDKPIFLRGSSDLSISNCLFSFPGFNLMDLHLCTRVFLSYTEQIGITSFLGNGSQLFFDHCSFRMTNESDGMLYTWGGSAISITHSTCSDYNSSDPSSGAGWGKGRFLVGEGNWGSNRLTYLGNNTTTDLGVRPGAADQNSGEQFLWEGNIAEWSGAAAASGNVLSTGYQFPNENTRYAAITRGRGLGQSRRIVSYNGGRLTLESGWNVEPDGSSVFAIGPFTDKIAVYGNYLDAKATGAASLNHTAAAGIEPYGGIFNFIADNNTLHELRQGISNWATQHTTGLDPNYFSLFANNKFDKCRWAMYNHADVGKVVGTAMLGTIYRNNMVYNNLDAGIMYVTPAINDPAGEALVLEHNAVNDGTAGFLSVTGTDAPNGFAAWNRGAANLLFYANTFNRGSASQPGPAITTTPRIALRENKYPGFDQPYLDAYAEAVIEAPLHVLELTGSADGNTVQSSFILYNAGATEISWTASTDASWLLLSAQNGKMADERDSSTIALSASPKGLAEGVYTANIMVKARDRVAYYQVIFSVTTGQNNPVKTAVPVPANLRVTYTGSNSAGLAWDDTPANAGVERYLVYRDGIFQHATADPYYTAGSLLAATRYFFAVRALTHEGDTSLFSAEVAVMTNGAAGGGLSYKLYLGDWNALPDFDMLAPVQTGTTANIDLEVRPAGTDDHFAFLWEGYINIPAAGTYTFETVSDDGSKFYFNTLYASGATPLVDNDGLHATHAVSATVDVPAAGRYPVAISFFEKTGLESVQLYWSSASIARQPVPDSAFAEETAVAVSSRLKTLHSARNAADGASIDAYSKFTAKNIYPNPFRETIYLPVISKEKNSLVSVRIWSSDGRLMFEKNYPNIPMGSTTLKLSLNKETAIQKGVYIIEMCVNGVLQKTWQVLKL